MPFAELAACLSAFCEVLSVLGGAHVLVGCAFVFFVGCCVVDVVLVASGVFLLVCICACCCFCFLLVSVFRRFVGLFVVFVGVDFLILRLLSLAFSIIWGI